MSPHCGRHCVQAPDPRPTGYTHMHTHIPDPYLSTACLTSSGLHAPCPHYAGAQWPCPFLGLSSASSLWQAIGECQFPYEGPPSTPDGNVKRAELC